MINATILSDLHLNPTDVAPFKRNFIINMQQAKYNTLIIPGDLMDTFNPQILDETFDFLKGLYPTIIFVPGNHEYYSRKFREPIPQSHLMLESLEYINKIDLQIKEICKKHNVIMLQNEKIELFGTNIVGSTMWTRALHDDKEIHRLSDYQVIPQFNELTHNHLWKSTMQYFEENVTRDSIVITHHAPEFVDNEKQGFVAYINKTIAQPKAWIFGHLHKSIDIFREYEDRSCRFFSTYGYMQLTKPEYGKKSIDYSKFCITI